MKDFARARVGTSDARAFREVVMANNRIKKILREPVASHAINILEMDYLTTPVKLAARARHQGVLIGIPDFQYPSFRSQMLRARDHGLVDPLPHYGR